MDLGTSNDFSSPLEIRELNTKNFIVPDCGDLANTIGYGTYDPSIPWDDDSESYVIDYIYDTIYQTVVTSVYNDLGCHYEIISVDSTEDIASHFSFNLDFVS